MRKLDVRKREVSMGNSLIKTYAYGSKLKISFSVEELSGF